MRRGPLVACVLLAGCLPAFEPKQFPEDSTGDPDTDADGDGQSERDGDCDDGEPAVYAGAAEVCGDGLDNGCDGIGDECREEGDVSAADLARAMAGQEAGAQLGHDVAGAGDLDGDGGADVIAGAPYAGQPDYGGKAYVVLSGELVDATPDDVTATTFSPEVTRYAYFGFAVDGAGDMDGDGLAEVVASAPGQQGELLLATGFAGATPTTLRLLNDLAGEAYGRDVAGLGDTDGDGLDDVAVGVPWRRTGGQELVGAVVVLHGAADLFTGAVVEENVIRGEEDQRVGEATPLAAGEAVSPAGDVDGDGLADLLMSASSVDAAPNTDDGAVWLIRGPMPADGTVGDADAELSGSGDYAYAGGALSGGGDVDGDGLPDVAVGGQGGADARGVVWLVSGAELAGSLNLGDAAFFRVDGEAAYDQCGTSVAIDGDIDADSFADVLVGCTGVDAGANEAGAVLAWYGPRDGLVAPSTAPLRLLGAAAEDHLGSSVAFAGDVDGDFAGDVIAGATGAGADSQGAVYLWFGAGI